MTPEKRIKKLNERGIFYMPNMQIKLYKWCKKQMFVIHKWIDNGSQRICIARGYYTGQDPITLIPEIHRPQVRSVET